MYITKEIIQWFFTKKDLKAGKTDKIFTKKWIENLKKKFLKP